MTKKYLFLALYIILLNLFIFIVLIRPDFRRCLHTKLSLQPAMTQYYRTTLTIQLIEDKSVPSGSVLFFGDSIIAGLCVSAVTDKAVNFGISGDTTDGVSNRISKYTSLEKAKAVVLCIGINDIPKRPNNQIVQSYRDIISHIPVNIPVICSSVLPVDERVAKGYRNEKINALNTRIKELCSNTENHHFVDSGRNLKDSTGNLTSKFHIGDGIHLNQEGYQVLVDSMKNTVVLCETRGTAK